MLRQKRLISARCDESQSAPDGAQLNPFLGFARSREIQAGRKTPVVGGEFCPFIAAGPKRFNHPHQGPTVPAFCTASTPAKVAYGAGTVPGWTMRQ